MAIIKPIGRWVLGELLVMQIDNDTFFVGCQTPKAVAEAENYETEVRKWCEPFKQINPKAKFFIFAGPIDFELK